MNRREFTLASLLGAATASSGLFAAASAQAKATKKSATNSVLRGEVDAIVLGAGASGLQTAWLLEQEGLRVMVLEGRDRIGGRIHTLTDLPGYPEMGFNAMAQGYGRGFDAAARAGAPLEDVSKRYAYLSSMLWDGDKPLTREQWATYAGNPFPEKYKSVLPNEIVNKLVSENNPLEDWAAWISPENAHLDIPLHQFLKGLGLNDEAIRLAQDISPYYGTNSFDVSALMLHFSDGFVKGQVAAGFNSFAIKGGNIKLAHGMAKLLKGDLLLNKEVIAIDDDGKRITVHCQDGTSFQAKSVVSTMPFSTLRNVKITPGLSGPQAQAVTTLNYQPLSMAFITAKSPFWLDDKLPTGMWNTNGITVMPQHFGERPEDLTGFIIQIRGEKAHYWDRMGKDLALQRIIHTLETIRPATKGKLEAHSYFSWSGERFNGGDFSYFGPGHIKGFINEMAKPAGNLFFAGEHTAQAARGLEGALESAERVALEVLTK